MTFSALLKKHLVLVFSLFAISYLLLAISPTHAQTTATTTVGSDSPTNYYAPDLNPDVPRDQHTYVQTALIETMAAMICQLGGVDPIRKDQKCLGVDPQTGKIGFVENGGGALGVMGNLMAYTVQIPVSSKDYVNYLSSNFGFVDKTYAEGEIKNCFEDGNDKQGYGFCGIEPLIGIWVAMRNIAYLLFVIIFIIIGVAIMLRVHIDPRTVMTIENQIPKIITGIILVTFSFAIAGLLIDIMYVAVYLVGGILSSLPYFPKDIGYASIATSPTPPDVLNRLWKGGFFEISAQGAGSFAQLVELSLKNGHTSTSVNFVDLFGDIVTTVVVIILGVFGYLFILLGLIFATLRLWLMMIMAYINILLDIVFAPFWFLVGLLPGSSAGVGAWFKDMLANLAVFPTALSMLVLGKIFGEVAKNDSALFTPPLTGAAGNAGTEAFAGLIMLGFIFMTPHVLQITRGAIKAPNINYGPVFQPVGAGAGAIGSGVSSIVAAKTSALPAKAGDPGGFTAVIRRAFKV